LTHAQQINSSFLAAATSADLPVFPQACNRVSEIKHDLHGTGSGVKWYNFRDPDGNLIQQA
jgi:hypothetical protein